MAEIHGNFRLSVQNELTEMMKIACATEVPARIQELFNSAVELVSSLDKPKRTTVFFTRRKIEVLFESGQVGIYVKNFIAFDLDKLENCQDDMIIAAFLEEFVHCLLGIQDEKEVGYKVSEIYPRVRFDGEKYVSKK